MKRILHTTAIVIACCATTSAFAAKACKIVGTWTDEYGVTAKFTTEKKGTATDSSFCPKAYKATVTTRTNTNWDLTAVSKDKSCPTVSAALTFQNGGCTVASGTDTISGLGTVSDTWTKSAADARRATENSALSSGLK
jgi:hypothetical protein